VKPPPAVSQPEEAGVRPTSRQNEDMRLLELGVESLGVKLDHNGQDIVNLVPVKIPPLLHTGIHPRSMSTEITMEIPYIILAQLYLDYLDNTHSPMVSLVHQHCLV
jgi:hypothetical protein